MTENTDAPGRQTEAEKARERTSMLCTAILRINQSLDIDAVLQEIVDSARVLTGARAGVITLIGERGEVRDFVTSGLSAEEVGEMLSWPDGERLFGHLRDLAGPLRVADFTGYLRRLGFSPWPLGLPTLQVTPMHHRGEHLGSFFLGGKDDDRPFTSDDEEILVLFASQAGAVIENARTHRDVARARADLEGLIDTAPVGVVVFDAKSGRAVSLNNEARRIVEPLRTPGHTAEQLLEVVTSQHADGRDSSPKDLPLADQFAHARELRAEEIVLSVPDGRSVRTLINVTPIRSERGDVVSVVVTMQDLVPLDELEKQRAEFLEMVSHELRGPLTSIKGSAATVRDAVPAPPKGLLLQFFRIVERQADHMHGLISNLLDAGSIRAGTLTVAPEPTEVLQMVDQARGNFLSAGGSHRVQMNLPADLPLALADRERIVQVLNNLLSNAARTAPESSTIRIEAVREEEYIAISVSDEGRGIAPERLPHLFRRRAGLSRDGGGGFTGEGTGLGLAICRGLVEAHGGRIRAESGGIGQGARFTFTIPALQEHPRTGPARQLAEPVGRTGGEKPKILVVDDDPQTLRFVRDVLTVGGYNSVVTGDAEGLSDLIRAERPRLVLLDLMLPGDDGIKLMERVPELNDRPVIFLSGYGREETIASALASGAVDYVVKPFSPTELIARIRAALRTHTRPEPFVSGELTIDYDRRRVTLAGEVVKLTPTEHEVLRVLSVNAGRVLTYRALLRRAWRRNPGNADRKLVQAVMKRLRRKLREDAGRPVYILNERGVGYRMPRPGDAS